MPKLVRVGEGRGMEAGPRCPACGAEVPCGAAAGKSRCWCAHYPALEPDTDDPDAACYCERCLEAKLAEQERDRGR